MIDIYKDNYVRVSINLSFNPLPDDKFSTSKLKEFAEDNFKLDENGRKLSERVENTVGKEKLLVTSNFSYSNSVFKRHVSQGRQKVSLCGNGLKKTSQKLLTGFLTSFTAMFFR